MNGEALAVLLDGLTSGDHEVVEHLFRAYEPYLRMVVRRRLSPELRAKFDSTDVVQSVWLEVLKGFRESGWRFDSVHQLRIFLTQLARHRLIDHVRRHRRDLEREQPLPAGVLELGLASREPQPLETAQAEELWEQLLDLCPPAHREVLRLKREGALVAEIAVQTGLHAGSIRRILSVLSRRLAMSRTQTLARREPNT